MADGKDAAPPVASWCPHLKLAYETCFQKWYSEEFLRGSKTLKCHKEFDAYQKCVKKHMDEVGLSHLYEQTTASSTTSKLAAAGTDSGKKPPAAADKRKQ